MNKHHLRFTTPFNWGEEPGFETNEPLTFLTREVWKATPPQGESYMKIPACKVFHTYSYSLECRTRSACFPTMRTLQSVEKVLNNRDILYSFMIGGDGNVYEGRGFGVEPGLPKKYAENNKWSVFIAYVGKPREITKARLDRMENTKRRLIEYGIRHNYIDPNYAFHEIER